MRAASLALVAAAAAATPALPSSAVADVLAAFNKLSDPASGSRFIARPLDLSTTPVLGATASNYTPTVLMHGLGDAGHNAGMQSLAQSVMTAYPGSYAVAVDVADGLFSFITHINDQVDELARVIKANGNINGSAEINLVGLSQGGLIARGYIERYAGRAPGYPGVKNFVSVCGTQNGIYNCPLEFQIIPFVCDILESNPYDFLLNGTIPLSFADYFVTYWDQAEYLTKNPCLPDLNNELGNSSANFAPYKAAMQAVKTVVLSEALQDTVVYPHQSESFGGYAFNDNDKSQQTLYLFNDTVNSPQWTGDLLGLRTRFQAAPDSLVFTSFEGDHLRFSDAYWNDVVLPYLQ